MNKEFGNLNTIQGRDLYWARIRLQSDTGKSSTIIVCTSDEYIEDLFAIQKTTQQDADNWYTQIKKEFRTVDELIFDKNFHYKVYASNEEGRVNMLNYLIENVKE